jgi:hypothetical protein
MPDFSSTPTRQFTVQSDAATLKTLERKSRALPMLPNNVCVRETNCSLRQWRSASTRPISRLSWLCVRWIVALIAICLAGEGGLHGSGNDYGFDEIFARQVAAFGLEATCSSFSMTSGKSKMSCARCKSEIA